MFLGATVGDVGSMFHDATLQKENEYRQSKSLYLDSLSELEAFIRQREKIAFKNDEDSDPKPVTYTIIDKHIVPGHKRSLTIRLNRKVSEDVLKSIAMKLSESLSPSGG